MRLSIKIVSPLGETPNPMLFEDRFDAARKLAPLLDHYKGAPDTILVAIPRGALEIGYELARLLKLPLDIVVTKKIPAPGNEEYAIGALSPDGKVLFNEYAVNAYGISEAYRKKVSAKLLKEIHERYKRYRGTEELPSFKGKTVLLLDDGIATGFTVKAAIQYLKRAGVIKVVVAVPVAAKESAQEIEHLADEFICYAKPEDFMAVAQFYRFFPQVSDKQKNISKKPMKYRKMAKNSPNLILQNIYKVCLSHL